MGVFNFLKSKVGKATMVGTTAAAGVATNFVLAEGVKDDMKLDIIRENIAKLGVDPSSLNNEETWQTVDDLKEIVDMINGGTDVVDSQKYIDAYNNIMQGFNDVATQSHYQPQTLTGTCAVVAVMAIVWAGAYFLAKRKAKKIAEVQVEDIQ